MIGDKSKFKRDLRVDFLRGLALLTIFIDHVPQNRWAAVTQQNFGFSDAAELFVALAGFSAVLAYSRYFDRGAFAEGGRAIAGRVGVIYLYHIATLVAVAVVLMMFSSALQNAQLIERMNFGAIAAGDWWALLGSLVLLTQPIYFDILPLYVVLLALFPLLYLLMVRCIRCGLAVSAALWLAVQLFPGLNLPTTEDKDWFFNPFAWQLLLALGMAAAIQIKRGGIPQSGSLIALAISVLLAAFLLRAPWTNWPLNLGTAPFDLEPLSALLAKTSLGSLRLLHIAAFGYLILVFIPPRANWLKTRAARAIADTGRISLDVFCLGVVLSVVGGCLIVATGRGAIVESWITTTGVAALLLAGTVLARRMRERKAARLRARTRSSVREHHARSADRPITFFAN